jgi:hypothetical protein
MGEASRIMIRYLKWLARTRSARRMRLTAPTGLLLACLLLAGLPAVASASTPEMRGEWELVITGPEGTIKGHALIVNEADAQEKFASQSALFEGVIKGTFSGTLEGSKASVEVTSEAYSSSYGSAAASTFISSAMTVGTSKGLPSLSGSGELTSGSNKATATLTATRLRTYKEIEEQEAREKLEREEKEARENIRGEWQLVVSSAAGTTKGIAIITNEASATNEFTSAGALFEGVLPGSFSGILEHGKATVTIVVPAAGPAPELKFTSTEITTASSASSFSMNGPGTATVGGTPVPDAALVATRIKTYKEVVEQEAKVKAELEAKVKAELEAQAKAEFEAKAKAEFEAKAKAEFEAKAKAELEAKARAALEAKAKAELEAKAKAELEAKKKAALSKTALASIRLVGKTFTVSAAGLLSLQVTNTNPYAISGRITLVVAPLPKGGKAARAHGSASKKAQPLGTVSFGISPDGKQLVKLELSKGGRTELERHKTLSVLATVLTKASGQTSTTKTLTLTLHAGKTAPGKG